MKSISIETRRKLLGAVFGLAIGIFVGGMVFMYIKDPWIFSYIGLPIVTFCTGVGIVISAFLRTPAPSVGALILIAAILWPTAYYVPLIPLKREEYEMRNVIAEISLYPENSESKERFYYYTGGGTSVSQEYLIPFDAVDQDVLNYYIQNLRNDGWTVTEKGNNQIEAKKNNFELSVETEMRTEVSKGLYVYGGPISEGEIVDKVVQVSLRKQSE